MSKITATKQVNGSLLLSTIYKGHFVARQFYGHTIKEARAEFQAYLRAI